MSSADAPTTAFGITSLSHINLGNHNAGEGGSQLADLKTVGNRPYISGQAFRHAIRDALQAEHPDAFNCTPSKACGEIDECLLCDLFGYFNPEDLDSGDDPSPKRYSPLRVTPLEGQYDTPVTTDMILQFGVEDESGDLDPNIGYRELTENVYKNAMAMDVASVGRREQEQVSDDDHYTRALENEIDAEERRERIEILLEAIQNVSGLAGQARHMADFMPDLMIATALPTYNQRITNAIHVDSESNTAETAPLKSVLTDLSNIGAETWIAGTHNPEVLDNWDEVMDTAASVDGVERVDSITGCFEELSNHFSTHMA